MSQSTAPGTTYDPESLIGDRYKVLKFLGAGGMGTVYAVINLTNGQQRALKLLNRNTKPRPDFETRFEREGLLLEQLCGQPYLVEVYDSGRLPNGRLFIEMEHLQGRTLHALLATERLSMSQSVALVMQLLVAIDAVHGAGIVHRDVKPANIFVLESGLCKLLDFGVVKVLVDGAATKKPGDWSTAPGSIVGTMPYIAPEYAVEKKKPDHRVDIFAAGAVLGECLMGSSAFHAYFYGKDYIQHVGKHGYPSLQEMGSDDTPHELQRVFRLATMKDPDERYPTARHFLSDLIGVSIRLGLTVRAYEEPNHDPPTPAVWSGVVARQRPREIGARRVPPTVTLPDPMAPTGAAELPSSQKSTPVYPSKRDPSKPRADRPGQANASRDHGQQAIIVPFAKRPVGATRRLPVTLLSEGQQSSGLRSHIPSAPWLERPVSSDAPTSLPPRQLGSPPEGASGSSPGGTRRVERSGHAIGPSEMAESEAKRLALDAPRTLAAAAPPAHAGTPLASPLGARQGADRNTFPVNDGLEGPALAAALAAPAIEAPAEPKPVARPRGARNLPTFFALGTGGLATGVVATLAVFWWVGPPAVVVRVSPEPLRRAPAGVVAPAPSAPALPPREASTEPQPPEVASPATRPPNSGTNTGAAPERRAVAEKRALEAKLRSGKGSLADLQSLLKLCRSVGDEDCQKRVYDYLEQPKASP